MATVNHRVNSPTYDATVGARRIAANVVELGELHARLLAADCTVAKRQAIPFLVLMLTATVLALASLPVVVAGLGLLLYQYTPLNLGGSLLVTGITTTVIGAVVANLAVSRLRTVLTAFERSQSEFRLNLNWLKQLLKD